MIHSLQLFLLAYGPVCLAVISLITALALSVLLYGRRHEQRTRDRGSAP